MGLNSARQNFQNEEEPLAFLYRNVRKLRTKEIKSFKAQWKNCPVEEATLETEKDMQDKYPQLFVESGSTLFPCSLPS